jgi:hypothetical protein
LGLEDVQVVDGQPVDLDPVMRVRVDGLLPCAPVELVAPVVAEVAQVVGVGAIAPVLVAEVGGHRVSASRRFRSPSTLCGTLTVNGFGRGVIRLAPTVPEFGEV